MLKFLTDPTAVTWADVTVFYTIIVSHYAPEWTALASMAFA